MSNPAERIIEQVPLHYRTQAANFILFLQKYYEWLHRSSGFNQDEVASLRGDTSWITDNVDLFTKSGSYRDIPQSYSEWGVNQAIVDYNKARNPGTVSDKIGHDYTLEDQFEEFVTSDDDYFIDSAGTMVESSHINETFLKSWFDAQNFPYPKSDDIENRIDYVLLVSLLKHINSIKGTKKSVELFFNLFFDEDPHVIYIPKFDIAMIDDNFVPDVSGVIRDDYYYDEFTYVIKVISPVSKYQKVFEDVFMKYVNPVGFRAIIEYSKTGLDDGSVEYFATGYIDIGYAVPA